MYEIPQKVLDYSKIFRLVDVSKIIIDQSDGLWIYNGNLNFSNNKDFVEFPEWFRNFKEIRGNLDCYGSSITDFTGLENLESIGGSLNCREISSITSFNGLENLESIGDNLSCSYTSITDFTGLENLKTIGGFLNCSETSITSFKGLEQCEINPDYIQPKEVREKYKEWQEQARKSKQIQEISKKLLEM